ncbi:MAG: putative YccA/Bax inhibitor family protein, partial [Porticoccaceae bacterium]
MRSGNPALSSKSFEGFAVYEPATAMTIKGTATKTALLLAVVVAAASVTWNQFVQQNPIVQWLMFGGMIVGLFVGLITVFKKTWAPITT